MLRADLEHLSASEHKDWRPHVTLAYLDEGEPLPAPLAPRPVVFTHLSVHRGSEVQRFPIGDAAVKGKKGLRAAGLVVRAADTGRILMLQRAVDDGDNAGGLWEFPGGRLDEGENALEAAFREWSEEVGVAAPDGDLDGLWNASNGRYRGFVLTVPSEDAVDVFGDRDEVANPDGDPDGDTVEALAWWYPEQIKDNPAVRPELSADAKLIRRALSKSAQTPVVSTVHHPLGHEGLWHTPDRHVPSMQQLPAYHQNTARALMRDEGYSESHAIATAIQAIREWKHGTAFGGKVKVTPQVQQAATRADAEWEKLKRSHAGG
jgi:8-oxo-dGTP pyrophosphatase MutT (NUDIX family)